MPKRNDNYQYPLDETWTTAEIIKVTTFYQVVEAANESSITTAELLGAYRELRRSSQLSQKKNDYRVNMKPHQVIESTKRCKQHGRQTSSDFNTETR